MQDTTKPTRLHQGVKCVLATKSRPQQETMHPAPKHVMEQLKYQMLGMLLAVSSHIPGADPGFPIGGHGPLLGGMDLLCGCFLVKMYVKMKEWGPIGGACTRKFCM